MYISPLVRIAAVGIAIYGASARGREIRWNPLDASGNVVCTPGIGVCGETEIILQSGGVTVTLLLEVSGWDSDQDGSPTLGAYQGTVDASGFAGGIPENPGTLPGFDLEPMGATTGMGFEGAFQAFKVCSNDFEPPMLEEFDALSRCVGNSDCPAGFACIERPDYVFFAMDNTPAVSTAVANYSWSAASTDCATDPDGGDTRFYGGTLLLEVPVGAEGTYYVTFIDDYNFTLFNSCPGPLIPGTTLTPAKITIESADLDSDGISDGQDNCPLIPNHDQLDSDGDDVGDVCECDFDDNGRVDLDDLRAMILCDGGPATPCQAACCDVDPDDDSDVDLGDFAILQRTFSGQE